MRFVVGVRRTRQRTKDEGRRTKDRGRRRRTEEDEYRWVDRLSTLWKDQIRSGRPGISAGYTRLAAGLHPTIFLPTATRSTIS